MAGKALDLPNQRTQIALFEGAGKAIQPLSSLPRVLRHHTLILRLQLFGGAVQRIGQTTHLLSYGMSLFLQNVLALLFGLLAQTVRLVLQAMANFLRFGSRLRRRVLSGIGCRARHR
jgi:hypothetical protein